MTTKSTAQDPASGASWGLSTLVAFAIANLVLSILAAINLASLLVFTAPGLEEQLDADEAATSRLRSIMLETGLPFFIVHVVLCVALIAALLRFPSSADRWRNRPVIKRAAILLLPALVTSALLDIAVARIWF